jgi:hypothetical protein
MIGTVTFDACGAQQKLRLSMRAGQRLEQRLGAPYGTLMREIEQRIGFTFCVEFFAACLNDGKGVSNGQAEEVLEDIGGLAAAMELVMQTATAAAPEPESGKAATGNRKAG